MGPSRAAAGVAISCITMHGGKFQPSAQTAPLTPQPSGITGAGQRRSKDSLPGMPGSDELVVGKALKYGLGGRRPATKTRPMRTAGSSHAPRKRPVSDHGRRPAAAKLQSSTVTGLPACSEGEWRSGSSIKSGSGCVQFIRTLGRGRNGKSRVDSDRIDRKNLISWRG